MTTGYVLDDLALTAGLTETGSEHHHREFSRLVSGAIDGGPSLDLPALCLATATALRAAVGEHLAEIIAQAPAGTITIGALTRTSELDALRRLKPPLTWPALHAANQAVAAGSFIITTEARRYDLVPVGVVPL
jgi:hypothetical protein